MTDGPKDGWDENLDEKYQFRWSSEEDSQNLHIDLRREVDDEIWEYSKEIPEEIKRAVEGVDGEIQYAIIVMLLNEDGAPFSKIQDELKIHQQTLSSRLKKLVKGALITRKERGELDDRYEANYEITKFGEKFLNNLLATLDSELRPRQNWERNRLETLDYQDQRDWNEVESSGPEKGLQEAL